MRRWRFAAAVAVVLVPIAASAQDTPVQDAEPELREALVQETSKGDAVAETAAPGWPYPKASAARPLVMNKYMIRGTFSVDIKRAVVDPNSDTRASSPLVAIDLGAAFSPLENLEVGVNNYRLASPGPVAGQGLFPIIVSPFGSFGDMPIYVRYSFMRKDYAEMAADFVLHIPTRTNLAATFGLPVRLRVRDTISIDTGTELVILSNGAGLNVEVPFKFTYNPKPAGFIFADSGFSFQNLARNITGGSFNDSNLAFPVARNQVLVPLTVGGGYTHVIKKIVMIDVVAKFGWNPFVYVNPPTGSGIGALPISDAWVVSVAAILHTSPILHSEDP